MAKVIISNCEDGKESVCYLSQKAFKTSKGIVFQLNGMSVNPIEGLKHEIEFDKKFVLPPNINDRVKVREYLLAIGINRNNPAYFKAFVQLGSNLPAGENVYSKPEHS